MNIIFIKLQRMFNFLLQNKAFEELNAEQFRVVYFLNNSLSMVNETNNTPNNNTIEMYNGYMMDKLGLSVRMIQYHIKALEQLGYIKVVRPIGRNARRQPNKITINNAIDCAVSENNTFKTTNDTINNAIDCAVFNENTNEIEKKGVKMVSYSENNAINDAMDCTPNKNEIIKNKNNNNLSTIELKDLETEVTEDKKENKKEKVNEMKNAVLNEMEREVKNNEIQTSTSGEKNTNFNEKEPVYGNLTDDLFDEIFGLSSTEDNDTIDVNVTGDKVKTSSTETSNKATGDVETRSMEQPPTNEDKNAPEDLKTQNNTYTLQDWMTAYQKLILQVENTDVETVQFDTLIEEGVKLIEAFPQNEGNYQRAMQDLRYWVARKLDFKKSFKISERWNKYYRAA